MVKMVIMVEMVIMVNMVIPVEMVIMAVMVNIFTQLILVAHAAHGVSVKFFN